MIFEDIVSEEITEKVVAARTAVAFKKLCFMIESSYLYIHLHIINIRNYSGTYISLFRQNGIYPYGLEYRQVAAVTGESAHESHGADGAFRENGGATVDEFADPVEMFSIV